MGVGDTGVDWVNLDERRIGYGEEQDTEYGEGRTKMAIRSFPVAPVQFYCIYKRPKIS